MLYENTFFYVRFIEWVKFSMCDFAMKIIINVCTYARVKFYSSMNRLLKVMLWNFVLFLVCNAKVSLDFSFSARVLAHSLVQWFPQFTLSSPYFFSTPHKEPWTPSFKTSRGEPHRNKLYVDKLNVHFRYVRLELELWSWRVNVKF